MDYEDWSEDEIIRDFDYSVNENDREINTTNEVEEEEAFFGFFEAFQRLNAL